MWHLNEIWREWYKNNHGERIPGSRKSKRRDAKMGIGWERRPAWLDGSKWEGEGYKINLEGRQGPDPASFISQRKKFGFYSTCDGSHWMAVDKELWYNLTEIFKDISWLLCLSLYCQWAWLALYAEEFIFGKNYPTQPHWKKCSEDQLVSKDQFWSEKPMVLSPFVLLEGDKVKAVTEAKSWLFTLRIEDQERQYQDRGEHEHWVLPSSTLVFMSSLLSPSHSNILKRTEGLPLLSTNEPG